MPSHRYDRSATARIIAKPKTPESRHWPVVVEPEGPEEASPVPGVASLTELYQRAVAHTAHIAIDEIAYGQMVASGQAPSQPPPQIEIVHTR